MKGYTANRVASRSEIVLIFPLFFGSISGTEYVTLTDPATKADIAEDLIADGYLIADKNKKDRRLTKLVSV